MAKLHNDIETLPFAIFLACYCRREYGLLLIEGEATEGELQDAWSTIYAQSVDISENYSSQYVLELQKDIELLNYKITTTEGALKILEITHDERVVKVLHSMGHDVRNLTVGDLQYRRAIKLIEADLPLWRLKMEAKVKELQDFHEMQEGSAATEDTFREMLVRLGRFQHYPMRERELMTGEYFRTLKYYIQHYTQQKPEPDGE